MEETIASTKLCPFITTATNEVVELISNCKTTKCIAWVSDLGYTSDIEGNPVRVAKSTGYCKRLGKW